MPRFGRLYRDLVLAPLAEQLVELAGVGLGETAMDVFCDGGAVSLHLARKVGSMGCVVAADVDNTNVEEARAAVGTACQFKAAPMSDGLIQAEDHCCDRAVCLLTVDVPDPHELIREMKRVVKPGGTVAVMSLGGELAGISGVQEIRDVIRFDGVHQFWDAVGSESAMGNVKTRSLLRDHAEQSLEPYASADGTLRIPVRAKAYVEVVEA